jgi:hypothetical protein
MERESNYKSPARHSIALLYGKYTLLTPALGCDATFAMPEIVLLFSDMCMTILNKIMLLY